MAVAPAYADTRIQSGVLAIAPVIGMVWVGRSEDVIGTGASPVDRHAQNLREALADKFRGYTGFDSVIVAERTSLLTSLSIPESGALALPSPGRPIDFEGIEADYVLLLQDVRFYRAGYGRNSMCFPSDRLRQDLRWSLWDNEEGQLMASGTAQAEADIAKTTAGAAASWERLMRALFFEMRGPIFYRG